MRSRVLVPLCGSILAGIAGCSSPQSVPSNPAGRPGESPLAFPGAEGAGRLSLGGRGGRVVKVTNLNDSGPGSLRAAVELAQPRTILFDVSGTIALESPLQIEQPRVTIAGQSAPGDGITLKNHPLIVAADDVVIRYMRSRLGDERRAESDAIWVRSGRRIILDHVSASWSVDETLSVNNGFKDPQTGFYDVTVQWSIIAESLHRSVHAKGAHGYGSLIAGGYGTRISFHHNLWAHHQGRNPRPGNPVPPARDPLGAFHDYRSNVFYDWGGAHSGYNADTGAKASIVKYNFVDNTYLPGPASTGRIAFDESNELAQAWFAGNTMDGQLPPDQWALVAGKKGPEHRLAKPVDVAPVAADPAARAFERVLTTAGASLVRDSVDRRLVQSVRDRSGGLIDSQTQVGGWPALASLPALLDGDQDGMPDAWEQANGMNPYVADDSVDADKDGYTNLEEYLHDLATAPTPRGKFSQPTYNGTAFLSLQAAVNALPANGGEILLPAGEYREKIVIDKPNVRLRGLGTSPSDVIVVWSDAAATAGGTFRSATLHVSGDNFRAENLTIQNDYHKRSDQRSQAVALSVTADRAVFDNLRLLGAQDTLYAGSKKCGSDPCLTSRQYFSNCYIEGHVDFIFGDSKAFFERCQIHAIAHPEILITAHARTAPDQDKAFVFNNCTVTGEKGAERIYFGRPWRDYAAVIFMNTKVEGDLDPQGWREWTPGKTDRLKLAYYAEFNTSGRNSDMSRRQSHTKILSAAEAQRWALSSFLAGADGWNPAAM
ncbi:pectinesterase family protein [Peristeroidobacter agariperforans]|uniref:pectinesterase family protein n=1 Tax=Peristeroidobacter agariperforans TaxID=268404 RepID=UPI0018E57F2E|nr:pectinesterase family protein [Peristeroidobacter agariperforans]